MKIFPSVLKNALATLILCAGAAHAAAKPNIILLVSDDLSYELERHMLSSSPDYIATFMPNFKTTFVSGGMRFPRYYETEALCCPSRAAMLRGQYPHCTEVVGNTYPDGGFQKFYEKGEESSTIATWLQSAGYQTALFGKYLNGYSMVTSATGALHLYQPPGWSRWHGWVDDNYNYGNFTLLENGVITNYVNDAKDTNYMPDVLTREATDYIALHATQPYFLYLAPWDPHEPATPAIRYKTLFPTQQARRTASFNQASMTGRPWPWSSSTLNPPLTSTEITNIDNLYRNRLRAEMALDDMIGNLVKVLKATGQWQNTYIFFISDNGFHLGEHRHLGIPNQVEWSYGKSTAYEEDIHVPMYVAGPGIVAGATRNNVVLNIDIAATFAALGGAAVPAGYAMDGRSFAPLLTSAVNTARTNYLVEMGSQLFDDVHWYQWALRVLAPSMNGLYAEYLPNPSQPTAAPSNDTREFYDLAKDPYELTNIYGTLSDATKQSLNQRLTLFETCVGATCQRLEDAPLTVACDLNGDGIINVNDIQSAVDQATGAKACTTANLQGLNPAQCTVADVQRVVVAALGGTCLVGQ